MYNIKGQTEYEGLEIVGEFYHEIHNGSCVSVNC
jgi:hypothetical protein